MQQPQQVEYARLEFMRLAACNTSSDLTVISGPSHAFYLKESGAAALLIACQRTNELVKTVTLISDELSGSVQEEAAATKS
jgi:glycerol-3-phosphate dehydrogenase